MSVSFRTILGSSRLFKLLEREVALASPRINQGQIGDKTRSVDCVLADWRQLKRPSCLPDRLFFSAEPSIKYRELRQIARILRLITEFCFNFLAGGCKRHLCLGFISMRARHLSFRRTRR